MLACVAGVGIAPDVDDADRGLAQCPLLGWRLGNGLLGGYLWRRVLRCGRVRRFARGQWWAGVGGCRGGPSLVRVVLRVMEAQPGLLAVEGRGGRGGRSLGENAVAHIGGYEIATRTLASRLRTIVRKFVRRSYFQQFDV